MSVFESGEVSVFEVYVCIYLFLLSFCFILLVLSKESWRSAVEEQLKIFLAKHLKSDVKPELFNLFVSFIYKQHF